MTQKFLARMLVAVCSALATASVMAERIFDETTIQIDGEQRRYYRLHDTGFDEEPVPVLLISGSGCSDFGHRVPGFFENYPAPINLYFLEKTGIKQDDDGKHCSDIYNRADRLESRVGDTLAFIDIEPHLKSLAPRSLAILGFSEGGTVAPIVAARSAKIGWLATVGSGGLPQSQGFLIFAARGVAPYATLFSRDQLLQTYSSIKADPESLQKEFFGHPYRYWSSHLFYDPLPTYAQLNIPIVAAMGEKDDSVPVESGRKLRDYFAAHPGKGARFIEYGNAGHALRSPGKNHLADFIAGFAQWIKGKDTSFK